jgi:MFS family permease
VFALGYAAMCMAIASSLGMLLVPSVAGTFDIPVNTAQWMLTVNLLAGAVGTPIIGRIVDGRHKRLLLITVLCIVLIGSVIAATADDFGVFLVGRALQGLSFGIGPVTIAIARTQLPPAMVSRAISGLAVTAATGMGLGYPLTGMLAGLFGFRSAFYFAIAFVVSVMAVILVAMPHRTGEPIPRRRFDYGGAALFGPALAAILLVVSEGPVWGWFSWPILALSGGAAVFLAAWIVVELRVAAPMIDLRLFRQPDVFLAHVASFAVGMLLFLCLSVSSLISQAPVSTGYGAGIPVFWAGLVIVPFSVGTFAAGRAFQILLRRFDAPALLPIGAFLLTLALTSLSIGHNQLWQLVLGILLCGLGTGVMFGALPLLLSRRVERTELGSAVGFNMVLRTAGNSFGSAIPSAVIGATMTASLIPSAHGIRLTFVLGAAIAVLVTLALIAYLAWGGAPRRRGAR